MGYMDTALAEAELVGGKVNSLFDPTRQHLARADALTAALASLRARSERDRAALVVAVSEGRLAPDQIPATLAAIPDWSTDSPAVRALIGAAAGARNLAEAATRTAAPAVFAGLQEAVAAVVGESSKLTASLPAGVIDEKSAFQVSRGGAKHFESWVRLTELVDVWLYCHRLVRTMQQGGWLAGPAHSGREEQAPLVWMRFRNPRRQPRGVSELPPQIQLGTCAAAGAGPGLYDWEDAVQRCRAADHRERRPAFQLTEWKVAAGGAAVVPTRVVDGPLELVGEAPTVGAPS